MLSEWGGCDGASGRKQQQERAQHACIRLWGSAGWSQHSRAVWVPISAQLWLYQQVQLGVEQRPKKQRLGCQHWSCMSAALCGFVWGSGYLCVFWVLVHSREGCSSWSHLVMTDHSSAFCGNIFMGSKKHCTPWRLWSTHWRYPGITSRRGRIPTQLLLTRPCSKPSFYNLSPLGLGAQ